MNAANRSSTCWKAVGRLSNYDPSAMEPHETLYERLRRLVVEDPRDARRLFLQLLDSTGPALDQFLGRISSPADGRLRQLVSNALRSQRDRERLAPHLIAWQEIETDEFTHRAIAGALKGLDARSAAQTALAQEVARLTTAIGREMAQRERLNRELEDTRGVVTVVDDEFHGVGVHQLLRADDAENMDKVIALVAGVRTPKVCVFRSAEKLLFNS